MSSHALYRSRECAGVDVGDETPARGAPMKWTVAVFDGEGRRDHGY